MDRPILCVAVVVRDAGRILLLRRSPTSTFPGMWCLPGGKVEPGETLAACCRRELKEETGLDGIAFLFDTVTAVAGPPPLLGVVYRTIIPGTAEPRNAEPDKHDAIGWFPIEAMPEPLMPGVVQWLAGRKR